ncbi:hypothetical protein ACUYFE_08060, partial [Olegusella massiliensis]|uniref:hypothetical protein n=1 Tax=Olegusella massiliensis TaxID=1776381 RepID=UPI004055638C
SISAERIAVARRMKNNADESPEWIVPWAVFNDAQEHDNIALNNRLADLIDPVCELDLDFSMENIKCSACNKAISHGTNPLEMKYCPNCGARVVSCND